MSTLTAPSVAAPSITAMPASTDYPPLLRTPMPLGLDDAADDVETASVHALALGIAAVLVSWIPGGIGFLLGFLPAVAAAVVALVVLRDRVRPTDRLRAIAAFVIGLAVLIGFAAGLGTTW